VVAATYTTLSRIGLQRSAKTSSPVNPGDYNEVHLHKAFGYRAPVKSSRLREALTRPLDTASVAIEQQAVELHHAVDPLVIGR
jgi:hypothetical protein